MSLMTRLYPFGDEYSLNLNQSISQSSNQSINLSLSLSPQEESADTLVTLVVTHVVTLLRAQGTIWATIRIISVPLNIKKKSSQTEELRSPIKEKVTRSWGEVLLVALTVAKQFSLPVKVLLAFLKMANSIFAKSVVPDPRFLLDKLLCGDKCTYHFYCIALNIWGRNLQEVRRKYFVQLSQCWIQSQICVTHLTL